MLASGGNAVDAAIAACAVLGVVCPEACGIGGDLFALVHVKGHKVPLTLNASGRAGSAIDPSELTTIIPNEHPLSVTVPGCVYGWEALADRGGRWPLHRSLQSAVDLAEQGFEVSPELAQAFEYKASLLSTSQPAAPFYPNGQPVPAGSLVRRTELADTLRAIGEEGPVSFYQGWRGAALSKAVGGRITATDLARSQADWVEPLLVNAFGMEAWTIPPNSQGYLATTACRLFELLDPPRDGSDPNLWMAAIEAYRVLARDRDELVADPDHLSLPATDLVAEDRLRARADEVNLEKAGQWSPPSPRPGGTAYLCVTDSEGTGVSLIQSNFFGFGSGIGVDHAGYLLHNRGSGFNLIPGHPNQLGPEKRPLHTLSPTLWTEAGNLRALLGTRGGDYQPQLIVQLALWIFWCGLSLAEAQAAPRWVVDITNPEPNVMLEDAIAPELSEALAVKGLATSLVANYQPGWGPMSVILVDRDGNHQAAADPRVSTSAVGGLL